MKRKRKSQLSCCVARVPSAREDRGLPTTGLAHEANETASSSPLASQFAALHPGPLHSQFRVHTRSFVKPGPASFSRPTPLLGVPPLSSPIERADTPSARQCDRWAFPQLCLADSLPELLFLLGPAKPRGIHSCSPSAVLAGNRAVLAPCTAWREFRTGNLAASPSIPWRSSCPHGAHLLASAVCLMVMVL